MRSLDKGDGVSSNLTGRTMKREVETKFYTYMQNNSGGYWQVDPNKGVAHIVIVEAIDSKDANNRAEKIGLYFDGWNDCPCCGTRWDSQWGESDATEIPTVYGQDPSEYVNDKWAKAFEKEVYVHYFDGQIEHIK